MALALAWLAMPVNASQAIEGKRVALVIGNANYKENPLANPVNDAKAMCSTLKGLGFDTACIYDIQDKRKFVEGVQSFASKLNPQTISLFYYAGHGMQINGENFLIPTQAELKSEVDVTWEAVSVQYVWITWKRPEVSSAWQFWMPAVITHGVAVGVLAAYPWWMAWHPPFLSHVAALSCTRLAIKRSLQTAPMAMVCLPNICLPIFAPRASRLSR